MILKARKEIRIAGVRIRRGDVFEVADQALALNILELGLADAAPRNATASTTLMSPTTAWTTEAPPSDKTGWLRGYLKRVA